MSCERAYIADAVAALGDDLAAEIAACVDVLKTESDVGKRRVAENRYLRLTEQRDRAA
jgi:hypothetical protein